MFKKVSDITRRDFCKALGVVAATTTLLGQGTLAAHAERTQKMTGSHRSGAGINVVLVHGAFADASSWKKVILLLQESGFTVLAVQNPLSSLQDDVATTQQALASLSGPTILVGHSYGGVVITNAATTASNLLGLVYIAAFAPDAGESVGSIDAMFPTPPGSNHVLPSYRSGYIWVEPSAFPENFAQDVEIDQARALAVVQKPIAPVCFGTPSGVPAWQKLPSWYLVSTYDRMIDPDAERFMAKRMNAKTYEVAASHASLISHPQEVVNLIVTASQQSH